MYNCGYKNVLHMKGPVTNTKYAFKLRHVTEVLDEDADELLCMDSRNVPWCSKHDRSLPPFMKLDKWCAGDSGRFEYGNKDPQRFNKDEYLKLFIFPPNE